MDFIKQRNDACKVLLWMLMLFASFITMATAQADSTQGSAQPVTVQTMSPPVSLPNVDAPPPMEEEGAAPPSFESATRNSMPASGKISFIFQDIDIRTLLQLIAKTSGNNFIISDAIKGSITLNLKNVTWRQALNIILKSHGLAQQRIGDAIYISTIDDIRNKESRELQARIDIANIAPLVQKVVRLRYMDAKTLADVIKGPQGSLLSARGEIAMDMRTNSLIIKDTRTNIREVLRAIHIIDIPSRQVQIEARIVNVDTLYEEQLGVRFGVSNTRSLSGTLAGANQLAQGIQVADVNPVDDRLNFDLPANSLTSGATPASIGLALARLGPILLDLELSALEEEGHIQIISRPRVVTSNLQKAVIETGEEIPYQEATSSGATSIEFKKAVLSLTIIPQITPSNQIILRLKATQDSRGPQLLVAQGTTTGSSTTGSSTTGTVTTPAVFGPPTINTQEVDSSVLLNNNETIVIGGVYKQTKQNTMDRVPFFGNLPVVGALFRHQGLKNETTELLIFITPKIVTPKSAAVAYYRENEPPTLGPELKGEG